MIDVLESDYGPLETFALRHRVVDVGEDAEASDARRRVRPLVVRKAAELAALSRLRCGAEMWDAVTFRADDRPALVRDRLRGLPPNPEAAIVVSWNGTTAVATDWALFTARWEHFCYPAAETVAILPLAAGWALCYRRYEVFQFQERFPVHPVMVTEART